MRLSRLCWLVVAAGACRAPARSPARAEPRAAVDTPAVIRTRAERQSALDELDSRRRQWAGQRPRAYRLRVQFLCFCGFARTPVDVTVRDSVPVAVTDTAGVALPDWDRLPRGLRVEELFAEAEAALRGRNARVRLRFDPVWGFPNWVWTDELADVVDEEHGVAVLRFAPLAAP